MKSIMLSSVSLVPFAETVFWTLVKNVTTGIASTETDVPSGAARKMHVVSLATETHIAKMGISIGTRVHLQGVGLSEKVAQVSLFLVSHPTLPVLLPQAAAFVAMARLMEVRNATTETTSMVTDVRNFVR
jgi:hypothetical protein